jgi:hypothetical protein
MKHREQSHIARQLRIEKTKNIIEMFFMRNLKYFKFCVIRAHAENKAYCVLYTTEFGELFMETPIIYLLSGPRGTNETYFEGMGLKSVLQKIKEYFNLSIVRVEADYKNQENNIIAYI